MVDQPAAARTADPIVTLTFSPALDNSSSVDRVEPWRKLRCNQVHMHPGGGGINVTRAIRELGGDSIAVAALGGHVGSLVAHALTTQGITLERVRVRGATRQNYAVTERTTGHQFRFIHPAAPMSRAEWTRCLETTVEMAADASLVVASSSLPPGVPDNVYALLALRLAAIGVPLIVDTSGPALAAAAHSPVLLIKPSLNELRAITGADLAPGSGSTPVTDARIESAARTLLTDGGCRIVVVSLGDRGALVVPHGGDAIVVRPPAVPAISTSGAGDSMVAGFAVALARGDDISDAARLGVAAGTAAVLAEGTGLCRRDDVGRLLPRTIASAVEA